MTSPALDPTGLRAYLQRLPSAAFLLRRVQDDFELVEFNAAARALGGEPATRAIGARAGVLAAGHPAIAEDLGRCWREQASVRRVVNLRLGGELRTLHLTHVPVPPEWVVVQVEDVSASEVAYAALARSEQKYRTVVESSLQAITISQGGRIVFTNRAAAELTGRTVPELLALRPEEFPLLVHPDDRETVFRRFEDHAEGRAVPLRNQYRVVSKDGAVRWVESVVSSIEYEGAPALMSVALDVTEQKRAEEARRASEERYRALVRGALYGIYRSTIDGRLLEANPALVAMLGYESEAELIGVDWARQVYLDPEERARLVREYQDAHRVEGAEAHWRKKDGTPITVRLSGRVVRDAAGALSGYEMIVEDVTAHRALEGQLRQAQKMEAIGQLAGGVAHDFNNLLTAILGSTDLLLLDLPQEDPRREDLLAIRDAGERAAGLTRQLLAFSRRQVLQPRVLGLNEVVAGLQKLLPRIIGEDIRLETVTAPDLARVSADPGQIEQVIMNLAVNARDAMPEGGRLSIETANADLDAAFAQRHAGVAPGRYVRLSVSDTGFGMDHVTQARIFEPFFTTKGPGKGTGLGLATVYGIVKQSGGYIFVRSEPGQGTTFDIYLPPVQGPAEDAPGAPAQATMGEGSETILVVEDDPTVRSLARRALERYGYRVLEAGNGRAALEVMQRHDDAIDLLLTDIVMPEMGGRRSAEQVLFSRPSIKVLFMSGYAGDDQPVEPEAMVQKPFTPESLARKVREVLDGG